MLLYSSIKKYQILRCCHTWPFTAFNPKQLSHLYFLLPPTSQYPPLPAAAAGTGQGDPPLDVVPLHPRCSWSSYIHSRHIHSWNTQSTHGCHLIAMKSVHGHYFTDKPGRWGDGWMDGWIYRQMSSIIYEEWMTEQMKKKRNEFMNGCKTGKKEGGTIDIKAQ